ERDWEFEPPHLEGDREVEEIPFRELPTAAAPASVTNIRHHDLLLAKVDELVLGNAQQLRGFGQSPGRHSMIVTVYHNRPLRARNRKFQAFAAWHADRTPRTGASVCPEPALKGVRPKKSCTSLPAQSHKMVTYRTRVSHQRIPLLCGMSGSRGPEAL